MKRILLIGLFTLMLGAGPSYGQSVYGTWRGTYTINGKFTGDNIPYESPPYDPIEIEIILHPYDASLTRFGVINLPASTGEELLYGGDAVSLSQVGNAISVDFFYPVEGEPTGYGDLEAVLSGDALTGTLNDRSPAGLGWVHYRGTVDLIRVVPEPGAGLLLAIGVGTLPLMRRRGAGGRTRTDTPFRVQHFKCCASTDFATPAR
jgi:hypothetical protein